jgi:glycosyltransferase involved in cell wall biosynthesis
MVSGASIVVKRLADGMAKRGHSVLIIAASDTGNAYIENSPRMRVVRLKSVTNTKRAHQRFVRFSLKEIYAELMAFEPDLIHIHDVLSLGILGIFTAKKMKVPVTATIHQLPWFVNAYLPEVPGLQLSVEHSLWRYSRWLNRQCRSLVVPTETIARTIETHGGFQTVPISNGVDFQQFNPVPKSCAEDRSLFDKYQLDPNLPVILHVGRLDVDKNVGAVVRAAAQVIQRIPAQLLVVGDGKCRKNLMDLSDRLGIGDYCHFPGFVDATSDLPGLYRIATVFTTASEIETQGLVLLEAMASGLPIVAVDATCIHEVVKNQVNGYLIPSVHHQNLADGLEAILRNPAKAKQMGAASLSIVQTHSTQASLGKHEKLYRDVIVQYRHLRKSTSRLERVISSDGLARIFRVRP